jgi:hypothetical protein
MATCSQPLAQCRNPLALFCLGLALSACLFADSDYTGVSTSNGSAIRAVKFLRIGARASPAHPYQVYWRNRGGDETARFSHSLHPSGREVSLAVMTMPSRIMP